MDLISQLFDLFLHLDVYLEQAAADYGVWIYALLFGVVFAETGLVVMPFLPGDSLIFTAGALAGIGALDIRILAVALFIAPILGDNVNYVVGRKLGAGLIESGRFPSVLKPSYIERTEAFFEKHGGKTISLARFFPIIRTFAPFMAGVGHMHWPRFFVFSLAGTIAWVGLFLSAGYFFGNIPVIKENLEFLVIGIIAVTLLPSAWHGVQSYLASRRQPHLPFDERE